MKSSKVEYKIPIEKNHSYLRYIQIPLVGLFFALLTILTTYPLFLHMGNSVYGFPGDAFGTIWRYWRDYQDFLANNFPSYQSALIGAPFGRTYLQGMLDPNFYQGLALTILTNEVIAYNLLVMLGIWATALMTYLLAIALWRNQWAAILSGSIFGFCPSLAMSAGGHMGFTHLQWMPLYLLSLFYLKAKSNWLSAILCGIALAIVVVTNYYIGYIMIVATVVFATCWASYSVRWKGPYSSWKPAGLLLLALLIGTILSLPWTWPILRTILFDNASDSPISGIAQRPYHTLFSNSARPWDYILPPLDHPLLGDITKTIYDSLKSIDLGIKGMPGLEENWPTKYGGWWGQVYLGWTPLALAVYGLTTAFRWRKGLIKHRERFTLIFFAILFAVTVWFAMPPEIPIGKLMRNLWPAFPDWTIPTPSYLLYHLLPMFRRYMVFGIATILSVAVLAGFGMRELLLRRQSRWGKVLAVILIFGLISFEFLHEPRHVRFPAIPQEYAWLATQPQDTIIAEYPFLQFRYALFFQRYHGKRMLNAWWGVHVVDEIIGPRVVNLTDPLTAERLGALGIRYAVVHTYDYFGPNPVDEAQGKGISKPLLRHVPGLELVKETPTAQIFKVSNNSALMIVYPDPSAKGKRPWLSDTIWKWQSNKQRLYIANAQDKRVKVTLSARSPRADGRFRLFYEHDNRKEFRQLQWNNGRVFISDVVLGPKSETIIEVSFPNKIGKEATIWSELSVDIVPA